MIKFFRHIRLSLIGQNKMGRYFKYAIGEILLVMIGILLALQVNTWNENRLLRNNEQELLHLLKNSIADDYTEINKELNKVRYDMARSVRILDHLKSKNSYPDSLYSDFSALTINRFVNFNQVAIKAFETKEYLVTNNELRYALVNLYNERYTTIEGQIANLQVNTSTFYRPLLKSRFIYPEDITFGKINEQSIVLFPMEPIDFVGLKDDVEFNNAVKTCKINLKVLESRMTEVIKAIDKVQQILESELRD